MSLSGTPHPAVDSLNVDAEMSEMFGRLDDYLDIPDELTSFSPSDVICTALLFDYHHPRIAARLKGQSESDRWVNAWGKVGSHLWSIFPPHRVDPTAPR